MGWRWAGMGSRGCPRGRGMTLLGKLWHCTERKVRFTWPRTGHRREHQSTAQRLGVPGLPDPGLFLFHIQWLFHMECINAVMPQSTTSWTCTPITRLLKRWVVLALSKRAIMPAIWERSNPPVCLVSLQRIPTGPGLPPGVSQEDLLTLKSSRYFYRLSRETHREL